MNKRTRIIAVFSLVICLFSLLSTVIGAATYASDETGRKDVGNAIESIIIGKEEITADSSDSGYYGSLFDILSPFFDMDFSLTPDGNMSGIDDYVVTDDETEEYVKSGKQFITVKTKSGNEFYLVIDRDSKEEKVYFLNLVDERDLFDLLDEKEAVKLECTCSEKCTEGKIDSSCPVCHYSAGECTGKEIIIPEKAEEKTEKKNNIVPFVLIAAAGGLLVFWFVKKPGNRGKRDRDD